MTLDEITEKASKEYCPDAERSDFMADRSIIRFVQKAFMDGASWERNRDKWISVEEELPKPLETVWLSNGNGWTTLGCRTPLDPDGNWCWAQTNGIIYEENGKIISECESDDLDVIFWSPLPELPKQKEN